MVSWDESEHPRDRAGRFRDAAGGWADELGARIGGNRGWPHYKPGKDLLPWLVSSRDEVSRGAYNEQLGEYGDPWLHQIAKKQGWLEPIPTATDDELDQLVRGGGIEVWRGVYGWSNPEYVGYGEDGFGQLAHPWRDSPATAHAMAEQYRNGGIRYGKGIYGNGIYVSVGIGTGLRYAGSMERGETLDEAKRQAVESDALMRMVLRPDARTIAYGSPEFQDELKRYRENVPRAFGGKKYHLDPADPEMRSRPDLYFTQDLGFVMASLGYDAIFIDYPDDGTPEPKDQYIILNPTALVVAQSKWDPDAMERRARGKLRAQLREMPDSREMKEKLLGVSWDRVEQFLNSV